MRAMLMTAVGGPEVLQLADLPDPEISGEHDVLVRLRAAGQFALVQAGAGGVGHMSVQIARLAGARVAATVRPGPKAQLASSLGAELCIDYTREDVAEKLRGWSGMDGADVVHDTAGGKTFTACFSLVHRALEAGQITGKAVLTMP